MSNPHFPGLAGAPLSMVGVWRTSRPVLILLASVALGAIARTGLSRVIVAGVIGAVVLLVWAATRLLHRHLDTNPSRVPLVVEAEVAGWVLTTIAVLAVLVNGFAWLAERFPDKGPAYLLGVVAGALLGFLAKDLFRPIENQNWFGLRFRELMTRLYGPYFYFKRGAVYEGGEKARWKPDGVVSSALRREVCEPSEGARIDGWGRKSRRARVVLVKKGLDDEPWNPDPNDGFI